MSDNSNNNEKNQEFNDAKQYEAYIELCNIFRRAIETQDYSSLEPAIAIWKHKYKLDNLSDIEKIFTNREVARKIKSILNRDYLSRLIGDYLASKVLAEQKSQQNYYDSLKKIIEKANKNKDYKTAKKEVVRWKNDLHSNGLNIYDFNKVYTRNILKMLLLPSQELEKQQEASESLKTLVERSRGVRSDELYSEITSWQNKYSIDSFPDDLKKELNSITTDVFSSISLKRDEETALQEMQDYVSTEDGKNSPADEIPRILSKYNYDKFSEESKKKIRDFATEAMSLTELTVNNAELTPTKDSKSTTLGYIPPLQKAALFDLKNIFSKNAHDLSSLFDWIYLNRKINFVPSAVDELKAMFSMAGFKKPQSNDYSIPSLNTDTKKLSKKDISKVQEQVVLCYLGILYADNKSLSAVSKNNISEIHKKEKVLSVVGENTNTKKAPIVLPVQDDTIVTSLPDNSLDSSSPKGKNTSASNTESIPISKTNIDTEPQVIIPVTDTISLSTSSTVSSILETKDFDSQEELDESSDEINILIDNLLENPLETFEINPPKTEAAKNNDKTSNTVIPESEKEVLQDKGTTNLAEKEETSVKTATDETYEQNSNTVTSNSGIENISLYETSTSSEEEYTSSNLGNESTDIYDSTLLTATDQNALEEINYVIVGSLFGMEPIKSTSKTKENYSDYQLEKNNGFN